MYDAGGFQIIFLKIFSFVFPSFSENPPSGFFLPFAVTGTAILLSGCLVLFITDVSSPLVLFISFSLSPM